MTELNKTLDDCIAAIIHQYPCTNLKDIDNCLLSDKTLVCFIILICTLGLIGNGIVFCLLCCSIKRNFFSVYILNLAVADFGVLIAAVSLYICAWISPKPASSVSISKTYEHLIYLYFFVQCSSIHFLTAMSVDRCLVILFPVWHRCHRPKNFSAIVSTVLWGISCIFLGIFFSCWNGTNTIIIISFMIFFSVMVISTLILFIKVCCNSRLRQHGKIHMAILLSLLFFIITAISICLFVKFSNSMNKLSSVTLLLTCMNSSINPVIYFIFGRYWASRLSGTRIQGFKDALWRFFREEDSYGSRRNEEENPKTTSVLMTS
ncbi:mas-related G-protein coupled receptor member H-like [Eublepharis macularius]|uniref:Mas-related G-protein coupled receptor member H-like n=1 Tax=Eublepharis macularius TaxID=481883 RepID=A0AA97JRZ3_EUBMA|nr:mas-related G-protein coupled receptor member H-like [Eublepharis macularius]